MPSCSLGDSTHNWESLVWWTHSSAGLSLARHSAENILFCTQLCHKVWFPGGNEVPCIQEIKRECPQAHCVTFSVKDLSKQVAFTKEVRWAELPLHKHLRIELFGFCGGVWVFLLHRNHSQSYSSKLLVKCRVITAQIWGQLFLFLNLPLSIWITITPRNIRWSKWYRPW